MIIESPGNCYSSFHKKRRYKVNCLFFMKQMNSVLMIKLFSRFLIIFFKRCLRLKKPNHINYFLQRNTCSLSTIIEPFDKNPNILNIRKENWFCFFIQKTYSRGGIKRYPRFKHKEMLSDEWQLHKNYQIELQYIFKFDLQTPSFSHRRRWFSKWFGTRWYCSSR